MSYGVANPFINKQTHHYRTYRKQMGIIRISFEKKKNILNW